MVCGAGERSRTLDLLITNELLYQLSYTGFVRGIVRISTGMSTNGAGNNRPFLVGAAYMAALLDQLYVLVGLEILMV